MTEANFEAVLIGELGELRGQQTQLLAGLGEVKAEIVSLQGTTELRESSRPSGRVPAGTSRG